MVMMYFPEGRQTDVVGAGPEVMEPHTVRYWCRHTKELKGSQVKKAEELVAHDCLQYLGENVFICLPLNTKEEVQIGDRVFKKKPFTHDYNTSEYLINRTGDKTFSCNCQGWQTKARRGETVPEGANCSHVLALYYVFKLKSFGKQRQELLLQGEV